MDSQVNISPKKVKLFHVHPYCCLFFSQAHEFMNYLNITVIYINVLKISRISFCLNYKWFGFSLTLIPKLIAGHSHDYGDDLDYSGMETIELCDSVELEDSCVLVDNNALYAVSYRTRKLRSFKVDISLSLSWVTCTHYSHLTLFTWENILLLVIQILNGLTEKESHVDILFAFCN